MDGRLLDLLVVRPRVVVFLARVIIQMTLLGVACCGLLGLFICVEIVEEKVVVFDTVFEVIDNFLLFVYFDSEAAVIIKNVIIVISVIHFTSQAATSRDDELTFGFRCLISDRSLDLTDALVERIGATVLVVGG